MSAPAASIGPEEQRLLFSLIRSAIQARLAGDPAPDLPPHGRELSRPAGAFVTLRLEGALQGCIGFVETERPLVESVRELAVRAAFHDGRFSPLLPEQFEGLEIEISVLTPPLPIPPSSLPGAVEVGRDGLIVRHRGRSGLLLPQVASERSWDPLTFLQQTSRKAGLPPEAWSEEGAVVEAFRCEVYQESQNL
ncbi:MAG: AmmeMemoRadiSam system protein A [Planctomycetes bacterium]|nr:AmmeMemoRadiSam system protein A [Planctomycetota bacterium]